MRSNPWRWSRRRSSDSASNSFGLRLEIRLSKARGRCSTSKAAPYGAKRLMIQVSTRCSSLTRSDTLGSTRLRRRAVRMISIRRAPPRLRLWAYSALKIMASANAVNSKQMSSRVNCYSLAHLRVGSISMKAWEHRILRIRRGCQRILFGSNSLMLYFYRFHLRLRHRTVARNNPRDPTLRKDRAAAHRGFSIPGPGGSRLPEQNSNARKARHVSDLGRDRSRCDPYPHLF